MVKDADRGNHESFCNCIRDPERSCNCIASGYIEKIESLESDFKKIVKGEDDDGLVLGSSGMREIAKGALGNG